VRSGSLGTPIVDAGMRQLAARGLRGQSRILVARAARLITPSSHQDDLYLDRSVGAAHFWDPLVDPTSPITLGTGGGWRVPATTPGQTAGSTHATCSVLRAGRPARASSTRRAPSWMWWCRSRPGQKAAP